jgi:ATP-binding cassette subfamily B protein
MSLSPSFFNKHPAGALLTRGTSDVEALGETLTAGVVTILLDILMMLGILVVMFWLDWRLTLILLVIAPPLMWVLAFCRRNLRFYFLQSRESLALVNATLAERIAGVQIVQLFNHHRQTQDIFVAHNEQLRDANIRSNFYDALMYAFVDGVSSICIALILWYATRDWFGTAVTVGLLVAFIEYLQRLFRPIQEFAIKIAIIQRAATALTKIFGLLDNREMIEQGQIKPPQHRGHIVMSDVYFAYRDRDILRGISAEIKPGEVVAIVGATGCGKTTLTRLLTRSYDNYRGSIQIDGCELSQLDLDKLRELIAVVPQDIHLFSDTVAFNIGLNHPQIDLNSIQQAAALVHADSFIADLPDTWQHTLRERGSNLSLGQGQLLTFARTMAYNPEIIILDEATASIDSQTEALIQDAIIRIFQRKTAIVIAHRLSTIMSADRILVMKEGQIAEHGTHDQLMQRDGLYAQLFRKGFNQSSPQ